MNTPKSIPPKDREEWGKMVRGDINFYFKNFVLQMKVHQAEESLKVGGHTEQELIDDLYQLCEKYSLAVQPDMKQIFKEW